MLEAAPSNPKRALSLSQRFGHFGQLLNPLKRNVRVPPASTVINPPFFLPHGTFMRFGGFLINIPILNPLEKLLKIK
jgi:hypothetical protein